MSISIEYLKNNCIAWYDFDGSSRTLLSRMGSSLARGSISEGQTLGIPTRDTGWNGEGQCLVSKKTDKGTVEFKELTFPSGDFTIRFKFKLDIKPSSNGYILMDTSRNTPSANYPGFLLNANTNYLSLTAADSSDKKSNVSAYYPTDYINDDGSTKWMDVIITKSQSKMLMAINGIPAIQLGVGLGNMNYKTPLRLFGSAEQTRFQGRIDDLIILDGDIHDSPTGHAERLLFIREIDNNQNHKYYTNESNSNKTSHISVNYNSNIELAIKKSKRFSEILFSADSELFDMNMKYDSHLDYADSFKTDIIDSVKLLRFVVPQTGFCAYKEEGQLVNNRKAIVRCKDNIYRNNTNGWENLGNVPMSLDLFSPLNSLVSTLLTMPSVLEGTDSKDLIEIFVLADGIPTLNMSNPPSVQSDNRNNLSATHSIMDFIGNDVYELVMFTEDEEHHPKVEVDPDSIMPQLVYQSYEIPIDNTSVGNLIVESISHGDARYAVNFGVDGEWFTFRNGTWEIVTNASQGEQVESLNSILSENWGAKISSASSIKFSYYITKESDIESIHVVTAKRDEFVYAPATSYDMRYDRVNKKIIFDIKEDGVYKANYHNNRFPIINKG